MLNRLPLPVQFREQSSEQQLEPNQHITAIERFVRGKFQELTRDAKVAEEEGLMEESEDLGIDEEEKPTGEQPETPPILEVDQRSSEGQNDP